VRHVISGNFKKQTDEKAQEWIQAIISVYHNKVHRFLGSKSRALTHDAQSDWTTF